jgi:Spy/CpxP family protein refolding chaperone
MINFVLKLNLFISVTSYMWQTIFFKKMRYLTTIRTAGLALLISFAALHLSAQRPGGPGRGMQMTEEDIKERVDHLANTLELTEEQHEKALAIDMDFFNKMQIEGQKMRNMERTPENRDAMREKMMKMRDERNGEYEAILTPEQYKQFIELEEARREQMRKLREQQREGEGESRPSRGRGR